MKLALKSGKIVYTGDFVDLSRKNIFFIALLFIKNQQVFCYWCVTIT